MRRYKNLRKLTFVIKTEKLRHGWDWQFKKKYPINNTVSLSSHSDNVNWNSCKFPKHPKLTLRGWNVISINTSESVSRYRAGWDVVWEIKYWGLRTINIDIFCLFDVFVCVWVWMHDIPWDHNLFSPKIRFGPANLCIWHPFWYFYLAKITKSSRRHGVSPENKKTRVSVGDSVR